MNESAKPITREEIISHFRREVLGIPDFREQAEKEEVFFYAVAADAPNEAYAPHIKGCGRVLVLFHEQRDAATLYAKHLTKRPLLFVPVSIADARYLAKKGNWCLAVYNAASDTVKFIEEAGR